MSNASSCDISGMGALLGVILSLSPLSVFEAFVASNKFMKIMTNWSRAGRLSFF